jgi:hypothetical protein
MNKVVFATAIAALLFSSCKKDRTCTCTVPASGSVAEQKYTYLLEDTKKRKAKNACSIADDYYSLAEGSCKLDK